MGSGGLSQRGLFVELTLAFGNPTASLDEDNKTDESDNDGISSLSYSLNGFCGQKEHKGCNLDQSNGQEALVIAPNVYNYARNRSALDEANKIDESDNDKISVKSEALNTFCGLVCVPQGAPHLLEVPFNFIHDLDPDFEVRDPCVKY